MKVEMTPEQIGLHATALAGWERVLKRLDAAREAGVVPTCFNPLPGSLPLTQTEHRRFQRLARMARKVH